MSGLIRRMKRQSKTRPPRRDLIDTNLRRYLNRTFRDLERRKRLTDRLFAEMRAIAARMDAAPHPASTTET